MKPPPSLLMLGAFALIIHSCREAPKEVKKEPPQPAKAEEQTPPKKKSLINVPAGAKISDLTLPYRDKNNRKISLVTIEELTVEDGPTTEEVVLFAENIKLWLFDRNGEIQSTTSIPKGTYNVEEEVLEADEEILMIGTQDKFAARSKGGIFSLETGQAILLGPAITRFDIPEKSKTKSP